MSRFYGDGGNNTVHSRTQVRTRRVWNVPETLIWTIMFADDECRVFYGDGGNNTVHSRTQVRTRRVWNVPETLIWTIMFTGDECRMFMLMVVIVMYTPLNTGKIITPFAY